METINLTATTKDTKYIQEVAKRFMSVGWIVINVENNKTNNSYTLGWPENKGNIVWPPQVKRFKTQRI